LTVKLPGETRTPLVQSFDGGRTFAWVEPIPGIGSLAREHCRAHADGTLTVIEDHTLWLRSGPSPLCVIAKRTTSCCHQISWLWCSSFDWLRLFSMQHAHTQ
jgi:hypothetical protein